MMALERSYCHESATEHAVAADRFAREIVPFLKRIGGALAAAERQSVGPALAMPSIKLVCVSRSFSDSCELCFFTIHL
jgi:hypothetical protein